MPAVVMPTSEAIVRTPQQRRRYILKQDVARYGRQNARLVQLWPKERRE